MTAQRKVTPMTGDFPDRTNSETGPSYHTVPILVVFSLGENLNRRRDAERSEEYFRNLGMQSSAAVEKRPKRLIQVGKFP